MQLDDLQVVLKVAEFRSITAAATHLDMQVATASAAVKRVESALGVELFVRTTRHLRLSSAGERYLPQCMAALSMLDQAKQTIFTDSGEVSGEIRIAVSSDLGRNIAIPWIDEFMALHPHVTLRVHISDSNVDFYRDALDMALRYGPPADSNLYGFKICNVPRILGASPEYLEKYGTPQHPKDLMNHQGLFYQLQDILNDTWRLSDVDNTYKIKPKAYCAANDGDLVRRWCVAGKGVAIKSSLDIAGDLLAGRVVPLMPDYKVDVGELWLVCPSRQSITPTVRLLRDMFRERTKALLTQLVEKGFLATDVLKD
ncbi:LysR family transcriptional regulator [Marinomonas primoryensis]|uniref:LysR family transcriptional regulator n=1 Tax=Marinomonas primoryensis TaxID=178399 RepID=A0A859CXM6_9GAMM|nr:LysR family transcriptional regulator [Marinomonas primoryensis]QKK79221.1 LysR family transcriptional regulator [Marinomonas primoryensis]|tara:strand:- start:3953 stop:4891 length:939 start_codon:yes stop_codon:yes gene_type:complete